MGKTVTSLQGGYEKVMRIKWVAGLVGNKKWLSHGKCYYYCSSKEGCILKVYGVSYNSKDR